MVWFNILCIYLRAQEKVNTVDMDETGMMRRLDYEMLKKVTRNLKRLQDEAQVMKLQSGLWSVLHFTLPFLKEFTHSVSCLKELFKMAETYRNVLFCKKNITHIQQAVTQRWFITAQTGVNLKDFLIVENKIMLMNVSWTHIGSNISSFLEIFEVCRALRGHCKPPLWRMNLT